jgi:Flp pilus assembly protein TadG
MLHGRRSLLMSRVRQRGGEEQGVVLVIVAVAMVALIGMAALAIDLGSFYKAQRQAQEAADAGALAAAQDLSTSTSAATTDANSYATKNYPGSSVSVSEPSSTTVKVTVSASSPSFLGHILGLTSAKVSASAVAGTTNSGGASGAIFAKSTTCSGALQLEAGDLTLNGGVYTNGGTTASGHNNTYTSGTYGGGNRNCWVDNSGGSNKFNGSTSPTYNSGGASSPAAWPIDYSSDFPTYPFTSSGDPNCTSIGSDLSLQSGNPLLTLSNGVYTIPNGVYCYSTIEFNIQPIKCTCTFVAGSFQMNQGPDQLTPDFNGLEFYDVNDTSLNVNSNGPSFWNGGTLFAPNANITINAPSGTISGFVEGQTVTINGGGPTTWTGTGPTVGGTSGLPSLLQ